MQQDIQMDTKRLVIRSYQIDDEMQVFSVINDPNIYETTLNIPYPYPRDQVATWLHFMQKNREYKKGYECGIFIDTQYIGHVGIVNIDPMYNHAEITYYIGSAYMGKGYATEAVSAMTHFAFETLHLERIRGRCFIHNIASRRVLEKNGFIYEGIARHEVMKAGRYIDVYHSALLQQDFLKRGQ